MAPGLVSVIVVNHNRCELLMECLSSLQSQDYRHLEILVVDNGSTDESCQKVCRAAIADSRIRLLPLPENRGFSGGCNVGIGQARGEFVALLNNDAVAQPQWLSALLASAQTDPDFGMWASKILFQNSNVIDKAGHLMYLDGQNRGRGTGEKDCGQYDSPGETLFPDGCAALYRRRLLKEVGGFDEKFFAYGDDADLGMRARWLGWRCAYVPSAVVCHRHSSTTGRFAPQKVYWVERNRFWLAVKNFPMVLLLCSPLFTLNRWAWNLLALARGQGSAASFSREQSTWSLIQTIVRSCFAALAGLPTMLRRRRQVRSGRRIGDWEFLQLLWRFRISARVLSRQEH